MTIGMNNLGRNGGIGNQLFQYAALVGIAKQRGFDFRIPEHQELSKCFEMLHCGNRYGYIDGDEIELHDSHEFCSELFFECPNHIHLNGYFQSEKYFSNAERLLKWDLRFKSEIVEEVESKYSTILSENPVSIFVNEYNDNDYYNLSWDYFERAIEILGKERQYIICSNNIDLCKKQEVFGGDNFYFNDVTTNVKKSFFDLCLMSKCSDSIISNSTFSWWGAYLNKNTDKRVIAPDTWYGPGLAHISTKDLLPETWEVINS